jgi:NitT/TauT family transport system permease protein
MGGLGNLLLSANSQLNGPLAWAALVWLSVLGIVLFFGVVVAQKFIMPWDEAIQH